MRTRTAALTCALALFCLIDAGSARPAACRHAGVQTFDQPYAGARSPRNASYDIDVRLDHAARTLPGRETIRWRNISAPADRPSCSSISYWNAWRNADSTWLRERRLAGSDSAAARRRLGLDRRHAPSRLQRADGIDAST